MQIRWANLQKNGFTIVELMIVMVVISILAAISIISYANVQKNAADKSLMADLDQVSGEMQRAQLASGGVYPTTLPTAIAPSPNVTLTLKYSGNINYYGTSLSAVQNGVLMSQICQDLVGEGVGQGLNQAGQTQNYITGCGNWNHDSMQITGWDSKVYTTALTDTTLLNYSNNFTTSDSYNKSQETTIKNFYNQLVYRQVREGGSYPITSFWDSWATSSNGGVINQPLPTAQQQPRYCIEATHASYSDLKWHIIEDAKILIGGC